jgi:DNA replication protein DnaC
VAQQEYEIQNRYFKVIDYCYTYQISIVMTSNLSADALRRHIGERSWSRLQKMAPKGFMRDLSGVPDYRLREGGRA